MQFEQIQPKMKFDTDDTLLRWGIHGPEKTVEERHFAVFQYAQEDSQYYSTVLLPSLNCVLMASVPNPNVTCHVGALRLR